MKEIYFGDTKIPCITNTECKDKAEDIFKIRELSYSYGSLLTLRTTSPIKMYFVLCKKRPAGKKILQSIFFSNYSNVDFVAVNYNIFPMTFQKFFDDATSCVNDDFRILNAEILMNKIHSRYEREKSDPDELCQPHLNYIRYKLECLLLTFINMKCNRPQYLCGKDILDTGNTIEIFTDA